MITEKSALVLFSGGQDSTTCLAWALENFEHIETIGFNYGQKHIIEMECRAKVIDSIKKVFPKWVNKFGADHVLDLSLLGQISDTALTKDKAIEFEKSELPNTFVPGRNLLFFTFAATVAYRRGISRLVGGMCETDYSGYPDCRDNTLKSLQVSLSLGMDTPMIVETPLMWLNKCQTWKLAADLGGKNLIELIKNETHTCYKGDRSKLHAWGYGCDACPACDLRKNGFNQYSDKLI